MSERRPHGRELLEAARLERTPSARDRDRVFQALLASAAAATVTTAAASTAAAPTLLAKLGGGTAKWWLVGGLCSALAGGSYLATRPAPVPPSVVVPRPPQVQVAPSPNAAPLPVVEPAPAAVLDAPEPATVARSAPLKRDAPASNLELELAELHAAHAAYRGGHPEQALALVSQHRTRFPRSQLGVERSTLEVLSLCRLGRQSQAQALADKLRASARGAAALSGLEGSCAATPRK